MRECEPMDQKDLELERRVWQRVSGGVPAENGTTLRMMEQRCREAASVFRQLAQSCSGQMQQLLQELYRQEYGNAMTLLGMRILSGEEPDKLQSCPWTKTGTCRALALAYRESCQARRDYMARAEQGEHGPVFAVMARQEAEKMGRILALIALSKGG